MADQPAVLEQTEHACAIILGRLGVLVRGPSGSGKSRLCHSLIDRFAATDQFAQWVCDDRTILVAHRNKVIAECPPKIAGLAEIRFGGINKISYHPKSVLDLVVDLVERRALERLPKPKRVTLLGGTAPVSLIFVPEDDQPLALELILDHVRNGRARTE